MITEQQLDEMLEQQMKIPLLHRAMGVDLPKEFPKEEYDAWEDHPKVARDRFKGDMNKLLDSMT